MDKFDWIDYISTYDDLKHLNNQNDAWKHFLIHGIKENRICNLTKNFNYPYYIKSYIDLKHFSKIEAINHWLLHGINEGRMCNNIKKIDYKIIKENINPEFINNKLWAHLHCFDINKFDEFYKDYIDNIMNYFSVVITFSEGNNIPNYNFTVLKIENRGLDVGGKMCCIKYLNINNIQYNNILMLHSISNKEQRIKIFNTFLNNKKYINYICSIIYHYDLILSDLKSDKDLVNNHYYNWYNKFMKFKYITDLFPHENCLIASKKIIDIIYPIDKLDYFYSKLNYKTSVDCNSDNIENKILKDDSIEYLWQKLWLNICKNINGNYKILNSNDIMNKLNLKYNFDIVLYKLLNNITNKDNSIETIENIKKSVNDNPTQVYSLKQILEKLPLDFDITKYRDENNLFSKNKYEILNHFMCNNKNNKDKKWIDLQITKNNIKTFVIIFPQFHEIPENNKFWGNGFVEWWNIRKTYQIHDKHLPMHPHDDIGYYNILDLKTRKRWNDYAEEYGFFGYIYYHYWFSTGIVMNKPLDKLLEDGQPDKPWFLNWVNENWTNRWDGGNNGILLDVKINNKNCKEHFITLLKYFKHHKYYKINNKPCLGIYKPEEIHNDYITQLISLSKENGFDGITFIKTLNNRLPNNFKINNDDYCSYEYEFPPNYTGSLIDAKINNDKIKFNIDKKSVNYVNNYDIEKHYNVLTKTNQENKKLIRGIMPCWDNFPRHNNLNSNCHIQLGSNSLIFYLTVVKQFLLIKREHGEYYVINSLNEWAEQCVLEPSIQYEYSYLEAFKLAKQTDLNKINEILMDKIINFC